MKIVTLPKLRGHEPRELNGHEQLICANWLMPAKVFRALELWINDACGAKTPPSMIERLQGDAYMEMVNVRRRKYSPIAACASLRFYFRVQWGLAL